MPGRCESAWRRTHTGGCAFLPVAHRLFPMMPKMLLKQASGVPQLYTSISRNGRGDEAVCAASIVVRSHDLARIVDPGGLGAVVTGRAGHVERGVGALVQQEAVGGASSIVVPSHDLARGVDPRGVGRDRTGHVERGVMAVIEQEVSSHDLARVVYPAGDEVERGVATLIEQETGISSSTYVRSHDLARGVDPVRICIDRVRHVDGGVAAIIEQEA